MKKFSILLTFFWIPAFAGMTDSGMTDKNPETIVSLIETLNDPVPYIQSEAMYKLEKIGKLAVPYLQRSLAPAGLGMTSWRVYYLLAKNGKKEILPLLKKNIENALNEKDQTSFYASLISLGFIGGKKEVAFILDLLKKRESIHTPALMALHHIAKRGNPSAQIEAIRGIAWLNSRSKPQPKPKKKVLFKTIALPFLIAALRNKEITLDTRLRIIEYFISFPSPQAEEALFSCLGELELTYAALSALTKLKPSYLENLLISYVSSRSKPTRFLAIEELGKMKSKKSVNFLIQHLSYKDTDIQNAIIRSLARIGDKRAIEPITLTLLVSRDETVIANAKRALAWLKD